MTQPAHHPSEHLLLDYARGALAGGPAAVVAAHLGACPACRAVVRLGEAVGGELLEDAPPAALAPDALERALAALEAPAPPPPRAPKPPADWIRAPADVVDAAQRRRRQAAPGVWVAMIEGAPVGGPRSYLLGVGPGLAVPHHTHRGRELVCVLKGAFEDRGCVFGPGDFAESDESVEHEPRVTRDGECVCLIAADDLLVPLSLQAKLLHRFIRI
jgi:putative transcriptional regulator